MTNFIKKILVVIPLVLSLVLVPALADGPVLDGLDEVVDPGQEVIELVDERLELVETSVYSLSPITAGDTSGLTSVVLSLIGDYDPVIVEYRYQDSGSSSYRYLREVQPDYPWLVSAAIFALVLFCFFRILGGVICKR